MTPGKCAVHGSHRPIPLQLHRHHIHPIGMGGPDTEENEVLVCPTGHANIHAVLTALVFNRPMPMASRTERRIAMDGYKLWAAAGRPGSKAAARGTLIPVTP